MGFKCGIVGLPNVGKSTLFNALTETAAAEAANYPFCTIEPNIGRVAVPDRRLEQLATVATSQQKIHTQLEFVDIAGLVRGASTGEGLGNQFLAHIREVDAIIHLVRCFASTEDCDVTHVEGSVDPIRDLALIETELVLADLDSVTKRLSAKKKTIDSATIAMLELVEKCLADGNRASKLGFASGSSEASMLASLGLITSKPILYVANVSESEAATGNQMSELVAAFAKNDGGTSLHISAQIEAEIATLVNESEKKEFLEAAGLDQSGLAKIITCGYELLNLITFFTVGPKEAHAWTLLRGQTAPKAAGVIHTDFEKGFIRAETISFLDYVAFGGEQQAKDAGKMRLEGKDYIVQDGDLFHFRFAN